MKDIIKEYIKIFSYAITGIVFVFASFYLIMNIYHMQEVSGKFYIEIDKDSNYQAINTSIENIKKNNNVDISKSKGKADQRFLLSLNNRINYCTNALENDIYKSLSKKDYLGIKDVYNLKNALNANVINGCLIEQLHYLTYYDNKDGSSDDLTKYSDYINLSIDSIKNKLNYIDKDLLNNSSYYYNSTNTKTSVMDKHRAMYDNIMDTYKDAASLVELLSKWMYEEVGVSK